MRHTLLLLIFFSLPALSHAQLDVKNDAQILWGFVGFITFFLLVASGIVCTISGMLFAIYSPRIKLLKSRKSKHHHHKKPRTATIKNRVFYKNVFLASLGASVFLLMLMWLSTYNM